MACNVCINYTWQEKTKKVLVCLFRSLKNTKDLHFPSSIPILIVLQVNTALTFLRHQLTTEELHTLKMGSIGHIIIRPRTGLSLNPCGFPWK